VKPYYVTRTDENGNFILSNLADTSFKLFALKDINTNFIYDLPDEKIAFADSLVKPRYVPPPAPPDTTVRDSVKMDSSAATGSAIKQFTLLMFQQYDSVQQVVKSELLQEGQIGIYFRYPLKEHGFHCLNNDSIQLWNLEEISSNRDTVYLWLRNFPSDSLILQVRDAGTVVDTIEFDLTKGKSREKTGKKEQQQIKRLTVKTSAQGRSFNHFKTDLQLTFSYPLEKYDLKSIRLIDGTDTVKPNVIISDSLHRNLAIKYKWKEDMKYKIILPDSAFFGINGLTNDSLILVVSTRSEKEFGFMKLNITRTDPESRLIIQMLNEKDQVLDQRNLTGPETLKFEYLNPQKYKFKAILDENGTGRWDTGAYLQGLQPENVVIFPKVVEIRANWEVEEDWNL
jgi:hypothetical protein